MELNAAEQEEARHWEEAARRLGAAAARVIRPDTVVTAPWVRLKCQYGCGGYGQRLTCPPYSPTPEQTRAVLDDYELAILVHSPGGQWTAVDKVVPALEREVFLAGNYKAFAFGCGPCPHCEECNLKSCVHPREARPSMEASGIDVYATARKHGFPIEVVRDRTCTPNYYGLVLIR